MSIVEYSKNLYKILHWFDYFLLHELLTGQSKSKPTRGGEIGKRVGWQKQEAQR